MKYACLVYHDEKKLWEMPDEEMANIMKECGDWIAEIEQGGHHVFSAGLQAPATAATLRRRAGALSVTDGPFAETREFLGGFTILEARDLNEAIQLCSRHPAASLATFEVRPAFDSSVDLSEPIDQKFARCRAMACADAFNVGKVHA